MGVKHLFRHNSESGVTTHWEDAADGGVLLHYSQDAEPVLELNQKKRSAGRDYYAADSEMWRVASIPDGVALKWYAEKGVEAWNPDHMDKVVALLNEPEWRYLKTADIVI